MTPDKIIETYQSVQKVHEEYRNFGTRISWFVLEVILVTLLLKPAVNVTSLVLAGLIASIAIRIANNEHYEKIYSVSSSGFIFKCLQYQLEEGSMMNEEDVAHINELRKSAIRYLRLARVNMITNIFSIIFCLGFLLVGILQMLA